MCTKKKKCTIVQLKTILQSQLYARAPSTRVNRLALALVSSPAHLSGPCIIHRQEQLIFNGPHFNKRLKEIIIIIFFFYPLRHAAVICLISIALFGRAHEHIRFRVQNFFQALSRTQYWPEARRT